MDRSHLNPKHMKNANCLQEFVHKRCSKCSPYARTHAWRHFLHWWTAVSI